MPQRLESDCAYEMLTNKEQGLAEQDSLLLSLLMMTRPPEGRRTQVGDDQRSESESESEDAGEKREPG